MKRVVLLVLSCSLATMVHALDVTVYNQDLGLVRETRTFNLKRGVSDVSVSDIPAQIDATSVHFKSLSNPDGVSVLEQNFQYDLLNQQKLLDKYIGKEIEIERSPDGSGGKRETIKGTLLANNDGPIIKSGDKVHLNMNGHILLPELPTDFRARIEFLPLVPPDELPAIIARHDIGLALEDASIRNRDLTITNKILQYLNAGLAIVASDTAGQREVLNRSPEAGFIAATADEPTFAAQLDQLLKDSARLHASQRAARQLAEDCYCWEREAPRLIELVESSLR